TILEQAGAGSADGLFAITLNDHDNLVICQLASLTFKVPRIFTLIDDPDNEAIFNRLGIQNVLSINRVLSAMIEEKTGFNDVHNLLSLAEGKVNFTQIKLSPQSPVINKSLSDIRLPENTLISVILRDGEPIIPRGSTILREGDQLIVLNHPAERSKIIRLLTGEK
ncbi:MAG: TrkA C-terminal domain-containing protein, partial [Candidatus Marinimicrobia bacterium]|nr:TrkA C-terminal domain-containing protein [Candidatus Neomarinimicrobiota bacterium]